MIKDHLMCYLMKTNPIDDPECAIGCPFLITKDKFQRLNPKPIPEILSYEGFISEIQSNANKLDSYLEVNFKSGNG